MFVETKTEGEVQVQQGPSVAGFIAWLEKHPAHAEYFWSSGSVCACGKYAESIGQYRDWMGRIVSRNYLIWDKLDHIAHARPRTFGAALERARALIAA